MIVFIYNKEEGWKKKKMKRINKKGFTLIELLAVIIILGILMIIAIPAVTSYIQSSRKSAYVDSAAAYIDAVRTKVNEGKDLRLFSTDTVYMIPVGHEATNSCVSLESGGKSPFSETWKYAYVAVTYDGKGNQYYFIAEDGAGQGIPMISQTDLNDKGADQIYSSYNDSSASTTKIDEDVAAYLHARYDTTAQSGYTSDDTIRAFKAIKEGVGEKDVLGAAAKDKTDVVYIKWDSTNKKCLNPNSKASGSESTGG